MNCQPDGTCSFALALEEPESFEVLLWDFGNGNKTVTFNLDPVTQSFSRAGTYVVRACTFYLEKRGMCIEDAVRVVPLGDPIQRAIEQGRKLAFEVLLPLVIAYITLIKALGG